MAVVSCPSHESVRATGAVVSVSDGKCLPKERGLVPVEGQGLGVRIVARDGKLRSVLAERSIVSITALCAIEVVCHVHHAVGSK